MAQVFCPFAGMNLFGSTTSLSGIRKSMVLISRAVICFLSISASFDHALQPDPAGAQSHLNAEKHPIACQKQAGQPTHLQIIQAQSVTSAKSHGLLQGIFTRYYSEMGKATRFASVMALLAESMTLWPASAPTMPAVSALADNFCPSGRCLNKRIFTQPIFNGVPDTAFEAAKSGRLH